MLDPQPPQSGNEAGNGLNPESSGSKGTAYRLSANPAPPSGERRSSFAANVLNFAGEVAKRKPKLDEETKQVKTWEEIAEKKGFIYLKIIACVYYASNVEKDCAP